MKRKIITLIAAALMALSVVAGAGAAQNGNNGNHSEQVKNGPFAGNSGHFSGGSQPCQSSGGNPHCPPFGG
jgi:hypothetical protein